MRILVVEDQEKLAQSIKRGLKAEGYAVDVALDGDEAWKKLYVHSEDYELVLLDIMLPKRSGLQICADARESGITTPIIMLTAKNTKAEIVSGLNAGADDFITKPFDFAELLARIRTVTRRPTTALPPKLRSHGITLEPATRKVFLNDQVIALTLKEFMLLAYLMSHPGQVLNREQITATLWDIEYDAFSNIVDVHIKNLRKKLGDQSGHIVETVYGLGYSFKG